MEISVMQDDLGTAGGLTPVPLDVRERYGSACSSTQWQILIRHSDRSRGADLWLCRD